MDRIYIRDLRLRCIVGVDEEERREKQDVIINVVLTTDLSGPGESDRFEDALDYRALKKEIVAMVEDSSHCLIEALAERIAAMCLAHQAVRQVQVTVDKPGALRFAGSVAVEVTRDRSQTT